MNMAKQLRWNNLENSINTSIYNIQNSIYKRTNQNNTNNVSNIMNSSVVSQYNVNNLNNSNFLNNSTMKKSKSTVKMDSYLNEKPIEFEQFKSSIKEKIHEYKIDSQPPENRTTVYEKVTKKDIIKINNELKINDKYNEKYNSEDKRVQVICDNDDYANPFDSLNIIKKNQDVHDDITTQYEKRKRQYIKKIIDDINYAKDHEPKRLKITNISHKIKDPEESISVKQGNIVPAIIPTGDKTFSELYGHYRYPKNIFPEGREQFTLTYDLFDVILFGGLVANKSNSIWSLDPGNLLYNFNISIY